MTPAQSQIVLAAPWLLLIAGSLMATGLILGIWATYVSFFRRIHVDPIRVLPDAEGEALDAEWEVALAAIRAQLELDEYREGLA